MRGVRRAWRAWGVRSGCAGRARARPTPTGSTRAQGWLVRRTSGRRAKEESHTQGVGQGGERAHDQRARAHGVRRGCETLQAISRRWAHAAPRAGEAHALGARGRGPRAPNACDVKTDLRNQG